MLVECGFVRAVTDDGQEFTFRPSLARMASLGSPHEIVATFTALHGPNAAKEAAYVLACCCDQEDPAPLIGGLKVNAADPNAPAEVIPGAMPEAEQIVIARHLMQHGIVGKARPDKRGDGQFSDRFDAAEYIAAATVHLGLSDADAAALSMTDFQIRFAMKFPEANKKRDVPTREEYAAGMARLKERRGG